MYVADVNPRIVHIEKERAWVISLTQCGLELNAPRYSNIPTGKKICEDCIDSFLGAIEDARRKMMDEPTNGEHDDD